jgi:glucosamine--fructose-6-phosphate aminotransferase (isomerizing)
MADDFIAIPEAPELLAPLLEIAPLQLFAYYTAVLQGREVDRPRNLTKAVVTE